MENDDNSAIDQLKKKIGTDSYNPKTTEQIQSEIHDTQLKGSNQVRMLRWALAGVIILIAVAHLVMLYCFINKNGGNNVQHNLPFISDKVMLMFLGTTTADIFGLLFVLVKFLFPNWQK